MVELKKIDVLSTGKVCGILCAIFGLVWGVFVALITPISPIPMLMGDFGAVFSAGVVSIIVLPIAYGIYGFILGIGTAFLYNLIVKRIGGIKIELK